MPLIYVTQGLNFPTPSQKKKSPAKPYDHPPVQTYENRFKERVLKNFPKFSEAYYLSQPKELRIEVIDFLIFFGADYPPIQTKVIAIKMNLSEIGVSFTKM